MEECVRSEKLGQVNKPFSTEAALTQSLKAFPGLQASFSLNISSI